MTHSIQVVGGKAAIFDDFDLLVLTGLMTSELRVHAGQYAALQTYADLWDECRTLYGPGVIDLQLDQAVVNADTRRQLDLLLKAVQQNLKQYGDAIPAERLNADWPVAGVQFSNYSVALLESAIVKLRGIIPPV